MFFKVKKNINNFFYCSWYFESKFLCQKCNVGSSANIIDFRLYEKLHKPHNFFNIETTPLLFLLLKRRGNVYLKPRTHLNIISIKIPILVQFFQSSWWRKALKAPKLVRCQNAGFSMAVTKMKISKKIWGGTYQGADHPTEGWTKNNGKKCYFLHEKLHHVFSYFSFMRCEK